MEKEEKKYKPKEYADKMRVSSRTILNWIKEGKLTNVEKLPNGRFLIIEQ